MVDGKALRSLDIIHEYLNFGDCPEESNVTMVDVLISTYFPKKIIINLYIFMKVEQHIQNKTMDFCYIFRKTNINITFKSLIIPTPPESI